MGWYKNGLHFWGVLKALLLSRSGLPRSYGYIKVQGFTWVPLGVV